MYHDICDDVATSCFPGGDADIYKLSVAEFKRQMDGISEITERRPSKVLDLGTDGSDVPLFLTFDDGGKGAMNAADILDERGWKGHFFITTGRIGTEGFVDGADLVELHKRGHIIGSHSDTHPLRMAALSRKELDEEWGSSVGKLSDILGEKISVASVPGGFYSNDVRASALENGITYLFNSEPKLTIRQKDDGFVLGRYAVTTRLNTQDVCSIAAGKQAPRIKQSVAWTLKKPIKKIGGETFLKLRKAALDR